MWRLIPLGLALGAALSKEPPAPLARALKPLGCQHVNWTALAGGWWADCTVVRSTKLDGRVTTHHYVVFHDDGHGGYTMQPLVETHDSNSVRVKIPIQERVRLRDGRAVYDASTEDAFARRRVWDLASAPARPLEERVEQGKICSSALDQYASELRGPACVTDFASDDGHGRTACTWQHPDCRGGAPERTVVGRYLAIPLHRAGAPLRHAALADCATRVGPGAGDVAWGHNRGQSSFRVVAVDDAGAGRLELRARADDKTAAPAPAGDWQKRDHWELWLASVRPEPACSDVGTLENLDAWCQAQVNGVPALQLIAAPLADGRVELSAASRTPPRGWEGQASARRDGGEVVIELRGELRRWARDGAISLVYSDSVDGTRQDCLLATSPVKLNRPETFGRLDDGLLCDRKEAPPQPLP